MRLLKSDRDIELVSDFDIVNKYPCVTVEKLRWNKWVSLYLVTETLKVFKIERGIDEKNTEPSIFTNLFNNALSDRWEPLGLLSILNQFNMYMGKSAYEALVMMRIDKHCEVPGYECDRLPSKELYDKVIIPDNGDITKCNSFTEDERKQFKFYRDDSCKVIPDKNSLVDMCSKLSSRNYESKTFGCRILPFDPPRISSKYDE